MPTNNIIAALAIALVCAWGAAGLFLPGVVQADGPGCPSDWPDSSSGGSGGGQIDFDGFYTDGEGDEWYIIRSSDSNGLTTVRAYPPDDRYAAGYRSGSPDEVCYLVVRNAGATEDAARPRRISFQSEREASASTTSPATGGGSAGGGSTSVNSVGVVEILAAALEIIRHSGALVAADPPASGAEVPQYGAMVAEREAALNTHLATLDGSGHDDRAAQIRILVGGMLVNSHAIYRGRPALLQAAAMENAVMEELSQTNRRHLFPNADTYADEQFYSLVSTAADAATVSTADVLRYSHLSSLSSGVTLAHALLELANLIQEPSFVARIREPYDSAANRVDRDIAYLVETIDDPVLQQDVLVYARAAHTAGTGNNNYFDLQAHRLQLVATENSLVEENEENLARLRDEIGRLTAEALGRQPPTPETVPWRLAAPPGVTADAIRFGQTADFSGSSRELGEGMRLGILAAFHEVGRVHDRALELTHYDDGYEPDRAFANTRKLLDEDQVFALIGAVGTPTSRAAAPLTHAAGAPFIAPFTGAALLREPELTNVLNLRASYHQETQLMVEYLEGQGVSRVAVLYQNDSYGSDGLEGVKQALTDRDMKLTDSWHYQRNTAAVKSAVFRIAAADPQAVIIIGAAEPAARAIELLREKLGSETIFMNVSFVGSSALAKELGADGQGVFMTQVVPLPGLAGNPLVSQYRAALRNYDPQAQPGFISLEGYLAGRLAIEGLDNCGADVSRECFLNAIHNAGIIDWNGFEMTFGLDNQGSDAVFLTKIDAEGQYQLVP